MIRASLRVGRLSLEPGALGFLARLRPAHLVPRALDTQDRLAAS